MDIFAQSRELHFLKDIDNPENIQIEKLWQSNGNLKSTYENYLNYLESFKWERHIGLKEMLSELQDENRLDTFYVILQWKTKTYA